MTADRPILIWGAGAIGGVVGAYLVRAGRDIVFVDQDAEHVAAINSQGLEIEGPIDNFTAPAKALTPDRVRGRFSHIHLCVKAHHTEDAVRTLAPHLAPDGYVLSLQNGLNELIIADIVGRDRTLGAFVNFGADYLGPGLVAFGGRGAFVLGELDGATTPRLKALAELIRGSFEPGVEITGNIWGYLWGKLGYGALLFATALTNASIVDVLGSQRYRELLGALGEEVTEVTVAKGVRPEGFNGFEPDAFRAGAARTARAASFDVMVAHNRKSAKSHSGVWRDLAVRKRKTELDAQLGPIAAAARELGMAVPILDALISLIHEIEDGTRQLDWSNLDALAARGKFQS